MKSGLIPPHIARLMTESARRKHKVFTEEEYLAKAKVKSERQLQTQIVQYLKLRGIEPIWHATHKRTTANTGLPDILFSVMSHGFPMSFAIEVKFGTGTLSKGQNGMHERLQARPNAWRVVVVRNFIEVVDLLRELEL